MVLIGLKWFYLGKTDVIWAKLLCSDKSGSIRAEVVLFGQQWLYLVKVVVLGQTLM